ncbi:MAG TPA: hypothetical protein PKB03_06240, partial [Baekduia sp.]|nr:hypothetical protein [Baekduia sp.]
AWVKPVVEGKAVRFEIAHGAGGPEIDGTVGRTGATCLCCQTAVPLKHVRSEGRAGRLGAQLMAIAAEGDRQRVYLPPTEEQVAAAEVPKPEDYPEGELFDWPGRINVVRYGLTEFHLLFTNRQLTALTTFSDLVGEARSRVAADATTKGLDPDQSSAYADAVATYIAFLISNTADDLSSIVTWRSGHGTGATCGTFARQALPMVWDFAEANPLVGAAGDVTSAARAVANVVESTRPTAMGNAIAADARHSTIRAVVATDPPYYDNIGYADLSDFFYVWLRRSLGGVHPELFGTMVTPKAAELIATPYRHDGSKAKAETYFEDGFVEVFGRLRDTSPAVLPMTLFYAFKQSESGGDDGLGSTGWSTMLEGLAAAGWMVTATWPMRTEKPGKISVNSNMLASSVVLACRPRPETAGVTDRQGLLRALQQELPGPLHELQKANIAPVDLRQAAIGPGMAVFSRFAKVIEPDGSTMRVRTALGLINQVLD